MNGKLNVEPRTTQSLLNIKDVQESSKMSRSSVYKEISEGRIKPVRDGQALRFVASEIDQWILDRIAAR